IIGFIPSFTILYLIIQKYSKFFEEGKVYLAFFAGMIFGMVAYFFHLLFDGFFLSAIDLAILFYGMGFAGLEDMMKVVVLNYPSLQRKYDITYYGCAFGSGFAGILIVVISYRTFYVNPLSITYIVLLLCYSISFSLLHISLGGLIGYGLSKFLLFSYFIRAWLIHIIYNFITLWMVGAYQYWEIIPLFAFIYSFFIYLFITKNILIDALPDEKRKEFRRWIRRG
ncbi:MAG: hypothetical protein AB1779_06715, partial [Candidatus Thermoplasmatota archaeon]